MLRHLIAPVALVAALAQPAAAREAFTSDRVTVRTQGKGPDVILIPGLGSSPRAWTSTVAALPGYRYHLVQVAGFAGAPKGGNADGPVAAPVAEELARYIAVQRLKKPAVVGHSMGGTIGLMLAARHPASVGRLMVVDMVPFVGAMFAGGQPTTPEKVRPMADMMRARIRDAQPAEREAMTRGTIAGMMRTEAARGPVIEDSLASDATVSANAMHEIALTDLGPELQNIKVPVTVLYVLPAGVPVTSEQIDGFYAAAYAPLAGAKLVNIPDSAHFIQIDAADRFQSELRAFLKR